MIGLYTSFTDRDANLVAARLLYAAGNILSPIEITILRNSHCLEPKHVLELRANYNRDTYLGLKNLQTPPIVHSRCREDYMYLLENHP